jgi:NAD+ kinase
MKICFVASAKPLVQSALRELTCAYGQASARDADYFIAIGGDGTILHALDLALACGRQPVFGMRIMSSVGALANAYSVQALEQRLQQAQRIALYPLKAEVLSDDGVEYTQLAINEVVISRQRLQAAKIQVAIDGREQPMIIGDGVIVSTPIGSGGYNRSAGGPNLPYDAARLALTAIALHKRSEWSNVLATNNALIEIEARHPEYRPARLETSTTEIRNVRRARITCCRDLQLTLLFDAVAM